MRHISKSFSFKKKKSTKSAKFPLKLTITGDVQPSSTEQDTEIAFLESSKSYSFPGLSLFGYEINKILSDVNDALACYMYLAYMFTIFLHQRALESCLVYSHKMGVTILRLQDKLLLISSVQQLFSMVI